MKPELREKILAYNKQVATAKNKASDMDIIISAFAKLPHGQLKKVLTDDVVSVFKIAVTPDFEQAPRPDAAVCRVGCGLKIGCVSGVRHSILYSGFCDLRIFCKKRLFLGKLGWKNFLNFNNHLFCYAVRLTRRRRTD